MLKLFETCCAYLIIPESTMFHLSPSTLLLLLKAKQKICFYYLYNLCYDLIMELNPGLPTSKQKN